MELASSATSRSRWRAATTSRLFKPLQTPRKWRVSVRPSLPALVMLFLAAYGAYTFYEFDSRPVVQSEVARVDITELYDLVSELGRGTFGKVYYARRKLDGREYAVKVIRKRDMKLHAYTMPEIEAEARLMVEIKHPYLARLHSSWHDDHHLYLVMVSAPLLAHLCIASDYEMQDYYTGGELFSRISEGKGPYPEEQARIVALRLLLALQYLHEHNIAHRDLKPENIMIANKDDDTDVRICDFGGAKQLRGSGLRSYVGSLQYMAPEVMARKSTVLGQGRYDQSCDMWSMGMVIYVVVSGYTPFTGDTIEKTRGRVRWQFAPAHLWSTVSDDCKELIKSLLEPDTTKRATVEEALMSKWLCELYRRWSLEHPDNASMHAKSAFADDFSRLPHSDAASASSAAAASAGDGESSSPPPRASVHRGKRTRSEDEDPTEAKRRQR
jgi:serine/threonine protein kinase